MNITATDFRVGNWYNHHGAPRIVHPSTILDLWEAERDWIKPIVLTEDILIKAGFKKINTAFFKYDFPFRLIKIADGVGYHVYRDGSVAEIDYVHQLENLYYAIKGTELNIEL